MPSFQPLTAEQYATLGRLHERAAGLCGDALERALAEVCGADTELLALGRRLLRVRDEDHSFLDHPALGPEFTVAASTGPGGAEELLGTEIGGCRIVGLIHDGPGGMVFEALQRQPQRTVAVKVLRQGVWSLAMRRRFGFEADILGRLEHPHVARVYQAGVTPDGRSPYFVMEHVPGARAITMYCEERGLPIRQRLELFLQVCDAAHHGHQKGVIHRDLKPANILVNRHGDVKVIDFGVARLVEHEAAVTTVGTHVGEIIGTIPYMSPEQCAGDSRGIDIRADVYGLGAVLYELLCGRPPHDVSELELTQAIAKVRDGVPARPASMNRGIDADLETVVLKALEPEKERRYQSADDLGADVRCYLAHQPIAARPATTVYQLRKLARRNRVAFVAAACVLAVLVGATVVSSVLAFHAQRARLHAERALADSVGMSDYLLDLFLDSPDKVELNRFQLLERAASRLAEKPVADPIVEAKIREYIGHGYHKLGTQHLAEPHLTRALELRQAHRADDADVAKSLHLMGMLRLAQGRVEDGTGYLAQTLELRRSLHGANHMLTHPDPELLYFVMAHLPDSPESHQELERRRGLREQRPIDHQPFVTAPLAFEDGFDAPSLDPAWNVELHEARSWEHTVRDSRLTITHLEPVRRPESYDEAVWSMVRLSRTPPAPLGDFRMEAEIGWDTAQRADAVQFITLYLFSPGRRAVVLIQLDDPSLQFGPQRLAGIGHEGKARYAQTGHDTLPLRGTAFVVAERVGGRVTITWDGHVVQQGLSTEPVTEIVVQFQWTQVYNLNGSSTFGSEWIDSIRVLGAPASPP